jgi:hypothetical protein
VPQGKTDRRRSLWAQKRQIRTTEDSEHPRRMAEDGQLGEETRLHRLSAGEAVNRPLRIDQQLDRLEAGLERRLDEVFALTTE